MSVYLSIYLFICPQKPLHPSSLNPQPSPCNLQPSSFISQLISFSACSVNDNNLFKLLPLHSNASFQFCKQLELWMSLWPSSCPLSASLSYLGWTCSGLQLRRKTTFCSFVELVQLSLSSVHSCWTPLWQMCFEAQHSHLTGYSCPFEQVHWS